MIIDYGDYELFLNEASVSCVGHFEVATRPVDIKPRNTGTAEVFGPHRFCIHCGVELIETWDSAKDEIVWFHPDDGEPECITGILNPEDITSGYMSHENLTMDGLRDVYRDLKGKDVLWVKNNKNVLRDIYTQHDDEAGQGFEAMPQWNDKDQDITIDKDVDGNKEVWVDDSYESDPFTNKEWKTIKYVSKSVLYKSAESLVNDLDKAEIRPSLRSWLKETVTMIKDANLWHPRVLRKRHGGNYRYVMMAKCLDWLKPANLDTEHRKQQFANAGGFGRL